MVDCYVYFVPVNWKGAGGQGGPTNTWNIYVNQNPTQFSEKNFTFLFWEIKLSPPHKWFELGCIKKIIWFVLTKTPGNMAKHNYHEIMFDLHVIISCIVNIYIYIFYSSKWLPPKLMLGIPSQTVPNFWACRNWGGSCRRVAEHCGKHPTRERYQQRAESNSGGFGFLTALGCARKLVKG